MHVFVRKENPGKCDVRNFYVIYVLWPKIAQLQQAWDEDRLALYFNTGD